MHRPAILVLPALVSALLLAGCGGGGSTAAEPQPPTAPQPPAAPAPPPPPAKRSPTFDKADLDRIALGPKNAPPGLAYVKGESGVMSLEDVGMLPSQTRPLRAIGFEALHDSIFIAKQPRTDHRVSQRIWLFRNRGGATQWLQKTHDDARSLQFNDLEGPQLGDESWVASGLIEVGGGQAITYAFRYGNTVHTVSMYGDVTPPSPEAVLAAAKAAFAKARRK
jgi:hypothetical protein